MKELKVPLAETVVFPALLEASRGKITRQEYRTLLGQYRHGDTEAAAKGLAKILRRQAK